MSTRSATASMHGSSRQNKRSTRGAGRVPAPEYIFEIAMDAGHALSTNVRRAIRISAAKDTTLVQAPDCDNCIVQYIQRM